MERYIEKTVDNAGDVPFVVWSNTAVADILKWVLVGVV